MLGEGIIKGMGETARNFFGSYVKKERLTTVQYPEERLPQKEAARIFPFLVLAVMHQKRKVARRLLLRQPLFGILHGGQPFFRDITAHEIPRCLRHPFDDAFAEHDRSLPAPLRVASSGRPG